MRDWARSDDARVQAQLDRLPKASGAVGLLTLERIESLCARLGNPQRSMPPAFHVAGTNGKGSTIAWLRAAIEAAGGTVHAFTSPHLVHFNERIRVAGKLIDDSALADLLAEVIDASSGLDASFFEVTTAASFLAFSRQSADASLVEVGLGGRLDATNVVTPVACGIAALGLDHQQILGDTIEQIAFEKAGIAKPDVPLCVFDYGAAVNAVISRHAAKIGAPLVTVQATTGSVQAANRLLAEAMLRAQTVVTRFDLAAAPARFSWPARMHRLGAGPLTAGIAAPIILDGAHNEQGAKRLAEAMPDRLILMAGILSNRDAESILAPFIGKVARFIALPVPGHDAHEPERLAAIADRLFGGSAQAAPDIEAGLAQLRADATAPATTVLVMGSLYLAGEVLRLNREFPT